MKSLLRNSDLNWRKWGKPLDHSGMTSIKPSRIRMLIILYKDMFIASFCIYTCPSACIAFFWLAYLLKMYVCEDTYLGETSVTCSEIILFSNLFILPSMVFSPPWIPNAFTVTLIFTVSYSWRYLFWAAQMCNECSLELLHSCSHGIYHLLHPMDFLTCIFCWILLFWFLVYFSRSFLIKVWIGEQLFWDHAHLKMLVFYTKM